MITKMNEMKDEKGFTLIELMIVIAIIGILASIALPQFATFRMRAFNTAGETDTRSVMNASKSVFADYNEYGASGATGHAAAACGLGAIQTGAFDVCTSEQVGQVEALSMTLSDGVSAISLVSAGGPGGIYDSSTVCAKHIDGDKTGGQDTDSETRFFKINSSGAGAMRAGIALVVADCPAAVVDATDFLPGNGWKTIQQ